MNKLRSIVFTFLAALLSISVVHAETILKNIPPHETASLIKQYKDSSEFQIIDVRTPEEFNESRLANAINLDFYNKSFTDQLAKLDKNKIYLLYCRTGRRSNIALNMMGKMGFNHAYNMTGGVIQWQAEKRPLIK